jgi:hypothetical protein
MPSKMRTVLGSNVSLATLSTKVLLSTCGAPSNTNSPAPSPAMFALTMLLEKISSPDG